MPSLRHLILTLAALTAGALTAGCDSVQPQPSLTKDQAIERVDALAQEAFRQLPAGATLKQRSSEPDMPCDDGPTGRTFVETDYTIDYPAGWPVEQTMTILGTYWEGNGYTIVRDDRQDDKTPELVVEHSGDLFHVGHLVTYRDNGRIDALIRSSSPCM